MKKAIVITMVVASLFLMTSFAHAIEVWFVPDQTMVNVGSNFDLLVLANIDHPSTSFSLLVNYDHSQMILNSSTLQGYWFTMTYGLEIPGSLDAFFGGAGGFIAPSGDNLPLAILHFTCLLPGSSTVSLSGGLPGGYGFEKGDPFFPNNPPTYYDAIFSSAQVNQVASVPEPGMFSLLGFGIATLGLLMRGRVRRDRD
jgi:hypothetical protein